MAFFIAGPGLVHHFFRSDFGHYFLNAFEEGGTGGGPTGFANAYPAIFLIKYVHFLICGQAGIVFIKTGGRTFANVVRLFGPSPVEYGGVAISIVLISGGAATGFFSNSGIEFFLGGAIVAHQAIIHIIEDHFLIAFDEVTHTGFISFGFFLVRDDPEFREFVEGGGNVFCIVHPTATHTGRHQPDLVLGSGLCGLVFIACVFAFFFGLDALDHEFLGFVTGAHFAIRGTGTGFVLVVPDEGVEAGFIGFGFIFFGDETEFMELVQSSSHICGFVVAACTH